LFTLKELLKALKDTAPEKASILSFTTSCLSLPFVKVNNAAAQHTTKAQVGRGGVAPAHLRLQH
jgi:hypothetical protein